MDDRTITVAISKDEQAFIDSEVASGRFANGSEVVRAALAAFESAETSRWPSGETSRDAATMGFAEPASLTRYLSEDAPRLKRALASSEASGKSSRNVPDIIEAVKSKLRANGSL